MWILIGIGAFVLFGDKILAAFGLGTSPTATARLISQVALPLRPMTEKTDILPVQVAPKDPTLDQIEAVGLWKELRDFFEKHDVKDGVARMNEIFPLLNLAAAKKEAVAESKVS